MAAVGTRRIGAAAVAGAFVRSPPVGTVTFPTGTISVSSVTVTWNYSSGVGRVQTGFRIKIYDQSLSTVLYDTNDVTSAAASYVLPYQFSDSSTYYISLVVRDAFETSASQGLTSFSTDLSDVTDYPILNSVGSVYEIGLNGVGYMLADVPNSDMAYRRQAVPLESPRFSTGETPLSQSVERYNFISSSDWTAGAGQRLANRPASSDSAFWESEGLNPFTSGSLSMLPQTTRRLASAHDNMLAVVAQDVLYVLTGAKQLTRVPDQGAGATTVFSVAAAGTVSSMASDGTYWYVADGVGIWRNNTAADPGPLWNGQGCTQIAWCSDRLAGVYTSGGTVRVTTFTPDGNEEVSGGRLQLPSGSTVSGFASGGGYLFFGVRRNAHTSVVYSWQLGSANAPAIAFELPAGQSVSTLGFYQGNVFLRAYSLEQAGARAIIYRCTISNGVLEATKVLDFNNEDGFSVPIDHSPGTFAGDDRFVLFGWHSMLSNGASGVGAIDLSSGGWAKWLACEDETNGFTGLNRVTATLLWLGRVVMCAASDGVYIESTTPVTQGFLTTSHADLSTGLDKVFDEITLICDPIPAASEILVSYSLNGGLSYQAFPEGSVSTAGAKKTTAALAKQGSTIGLKLSFSTATTSGPLLRAALVRAHAYGMVDQVVTLPINCADRVAGLNGQELPDSGRGRGALRARLLDSLLQTRVLLQDIDWQDSQTATVWEMIGCEVRSVGVREPIRNVQGHDQVAVVTLRRSLK